MSQRRRPGRRLLIALLPVALLLVLGVGGGLLFIVHTITRPAAHPYLVTPETFPAYSARGLRVSVERWNNGDGTEARGWLLRGAEGAPAVVLLHRYGADRSWLLNLGVKINEATNCTILLPDLRGHGETSKNTHTTFGTRETADVAAAVSFLRNLKTSQQRPLVGERFGFYGVELGAYAALAAAARQPEQTRVSALVLDSVPASPDQLLGNATSDRVGFDNGLLNLLVRGAARIYFLGGYENDSSCHLAARLPGRRVLLLSGQDAGGLRDSTRSLAQCFSSSPPVGLQVDLPVTGFTASSATGEQGETYDRLVIEFFSNAFDEDAQPRR
ncbi:MAG TPA: alpha/beta fold hydrolase [Pyrinomonadaceae bacterium]|nr:alpha/beta fold hydrolase [Pyrinomonadaceae bacterium]